MTPQNKRDWVLAPHIFEAGTFNLCRFCSKPSSSQIHQSQKLPETESETLKSSQHIHTCKVCNRAETCFDIKCQTPDRHICQVCELMPEVTNRFLVNNAVVNNEPAIKCIGHTCPTCKKQVIHSYKCNKPANLEILCEKCSSQASIEENRDASLKDIEQNGNHSALSNKEQAEYRLNYEAQLYLLIKNPDGSYKDDWQAIIAEHINNNRALQDKARIRDQVLHKSKIDGDLAEFKVRVASLSPSEREQYERDKKRAKSGKKVKEQPKIDAKKAYEDGLKNLTDMLLATNPKLSKGQAKIMAEKMIVKPSENQE